VDILAERERETSKAIFTFRVSKKITSKDFPLFLSSFFLLERRQILYSFVSCTHISINAAFPLLKLCTYIPHCARENSFALFERERERERESFNAPRDAKRVFFFFYYSLRRNFFSTLSVFCEATSSLQKKRNHVSV
jgi:hypothetical protein